MNYVVLDMEWNIPKSKSRTVTVPFRLKAEIIQIGAVKMDEDQNIIDSFNLFIKPKHYTTMNRQVQMVTDITDADLEKGVPMEVGIEEFKRWCGEDYVFLIWGSNDIPMLEDNLEFLGLDVDWIPESFNAQWMFDDQVTMENRVYSLDYARYTFGIKGREAHDALNDAYNTAEVLQHLRIAEWIEEERAYVPDDDEAESE